MQIGKLNDFYPDIGFSYHFADSVQVPPAELPGNPLRGELLQIKWAELRDEDLCLQIRLPEACFVDTVSLHLGAKTALQAAGVLVDGTQVYTYTAQTGQNIPQKTIHLEVGMECREFSVLLRSDFTSLQLLNLEIFGAVEGQVDLFPTPDSITIGPGFMSLTDINGCAADCPEAERAAHILQEKLFQRTGVTLQDDPDGNLLFSTNLSLPADGYRLTVSDAGIHIQAANLRGFVMGAETFIKLIRDQQIPQVQITDRPAKPFRGVHLFIPSREKMDFAKRLIQYLISPMGYNVVILQVSGGMVYERHPKISESFAHAVRMRAQGWPVFPHNGIAEGKPITKDELRQFVAYIRSFGIEVIPEVQSLAHVQYLTLAYPEIAEIPLEETEEKVDTRQEDMLPSRFWRHDYCPSNPRSYEILFDVIDEIVEVFAPVKYVHMGHDEVRNIGTCRLCKGKDPARLFAQDVTKIHDYLASKGLKMMMWADMLQPVTKYQTPPAIDMIPKDIVMLDFIWYFHLDKDIEDNLLAKDYSVLFGNLYSSHFPRYESRIRKEGIYGGQISAWVATNEYELQKEGKLYDMLMTAQLLWADSYRSCYRLAYDKMLRDAMPQLRSDLQATAYPSRQPKAQRRTLGSNDLHFPPRLPISQQTEFAVGDRFDSLIFHHTALRRITRQPWSELDVVARYVIRYADGDTEEVPVTYGGNLGYWNRRQNAPIPHSFYRHTGYTATYYSDSRVRYTQDGQIVTYYIYEYIPQQNKPIASVTLEQDDRFDAHVFLAQLEGVKA